MIKIDKDGLLLCEIQAKTFELSYDALKCSSAVFIRRYMNSEIVKTLDSKDFLYSSMNEKDILMELDKEYTASDYGSVKYSKNELYWIGYIYRYYAYTYQISSRKAYKDIKPSELRQLFLPYHTLSPMQTVERILESKNRVSDKTELEKQFEIFRQIRLNHK